ncbi:MAG: zinc ribbon domain-containing protein [Chloroflexi bacterium]|nr:zinc ribbon domain-containing protein [Chloroflexota bacterium]MBU1749851.1 zinc ribbon domain-containing protein [Chloroflexota bacterium]
MDIRDEIRYRYPNPIALTYHNTVNAREAMLAHSQRLRLFEVILKYLASIAICQYLGSPRDDAQVNRTLRDLERPSLGQWNGFLRSVLTYYQNANLVSSLTIPGLYDAYFERRKDRPGMADAYNAIRNLLENRSDSGAKSISTRELFDALINYRNKTTGHGVVTRELCEQMNEPLLGGLEEMLGGMAFLRDHALVYIEDVRVKRGHYTHELVSYMGSTPPSRIPEAFITDDPEQYHTEEQLYICRPGQNVPALSLHPLMIAWQGDVLFLNQSARDKELEYLSYQSGQIKKPDRLIEDFRDIMGSLLAPEGDSSVVTPSVPLPPATPLERALTAAQQEDWAEVLAQLDSVPADDAQYAEAQTLRQKAQHQHDLMARYQHATDLMKQGHWEDANQSLQGLQAEQPGYRDVSVLLRTSESEIAKLQSLQVLYDQARKALDEQRWVPALDLLRRLQGIRTGYRDVGALLDRQERLNTLYTQALDEMREHKWAVALTTLNQLQNLQPDYRDVGALVVKTQTELEKEAELQEIYGRAKVHMALEEWEEAQKLLRDIRRQQRDFLDVFDLLKEVQSHLQRPCWNCGTLQPTTRKFCSKCGSDLLQTPSVAFTPPWVCWQCSTAVPQEKKFCHKCGAPREKPASVSCPHCGHENPADRKFCSRCGKPLSGG